MQYIALWHSLADRPGTVRIAVVSAPHLTDEMSARHYLAAANDSFGEAETALVIQADESHDLMVGFLDAIQEDALDEERVRDSQHQMTHVSYLG